MLPLLLQRATEEPQAETLVAESFFRVGFAAGFADCPRLCLCCCLFLLALPFLKRTEVLSTRSGFSTSSLSSLSSGAASRPNRVCYVLGLRSLLPVSVLVYVPFPLLTPLSSGWFFAPAFSLGSKVSKSELEHRGGIESGVTERLWCAMLNNDYSG